MTAPKADAAWPSRRACLRWAAQIGAAACLPAAARAQDAAEPPRTAIELYGSTQSPWLDKLRSLHAGRAEILRIVQLGDSHTAGDYFTGELRRLLQAAWGNAGAGWVHPAAVPGQRASAVQYALQGWELITQRQPASADARLPPGGAMLRSLPATGGHVQLMPVPPFDGPQRVTALVRPLRARQPLVFESGGVSVGQQAPDAQGWQRIAFSAPEMPLRIQARAGDEWELGPIGFENGRTGVTVSALGINGAQISHTARWHAQWPDALSATRADLLILAFGTNEAFDQSPRPDSMEDIWLRVIRQIQTALPRAGVLLLGPPDSLQGRSGASECPRPLWLGLTRRMQRRVAQAQRAAFWDWQAAMSEMKTTEATETPAAQDCAARRWQQAGLMGGDGVHFSPAGYARSAQALAEALMRLARRA